MPRKTKKQKLRAHTHTAQLPKRDIVISREEPKQQTPITLHTSSPTQRKEQLPLVPAQKKHHVAEPLDKVAAVYFRQDIQKTAFITTCIVILEIILYQLMQNGTLSKIIPTLNL
jgi:hypothetical protein